MMVVASFRRIMHLATLPTWWQQLTEWCVTNNPSLKTRKNKEVVIDFRRHKAGVTTGWRLPSLDNTASSQCLFRSENIIQDQHNHAHHLFTRCLLVTGGAGASEMDWKAAPFCGQSRLLMNTHTEWPLRAIIWAICTLPFPLHPTSLSICAILYCRNTYDYLFRPASSPPSIPLNSNPFFLSTYHSLIWTCSVPVFYEFV